MDLNLYGWFGAYMVLINDSLCQNLVATALILVIGPTKSKEI